ncbi:hypothetical protein WDU94_005695 [Cyamophila willieti]
MDIKSLNIDQYVGTTSCYVCSFCKAPKPSPATLKTHLNSCCSNFAKKYNFKIPTRAKSHYCKTCNDNAPYKNKEFKHHIKENHPELILNCLSCSSFFLKKRQLQSHIKVKHLRKASTKYNERKTDKTVTKTPFLCEFCSLQCINKSGYTQHLKKIHLNPTNKTDSKRLIRQGFRPRDRKQKVLRNGWEWQYCHVCDKTLQFKEGPAALEFHLLKHKYPNNKVKCCNREYEYYCKYKNHIQSHSKTWSCKLCGVPCESMVLLQDHITANHSRTAYCDECHYDAKTFGNYTKHMLAVHYVKDTRCVLCDQEFETKKELMMHRRQFHWEEFSIRTQSDLPEPVICCGKKFLKGDNLKRHTAKHQDTPCKTCGDVLKSKLALLSHNAAHHTQGVKCSYCDKIYTNSDSLKYHMLKHTHGRQIKCVCGLMFYTEADMHRHQRARKTPCTGRNVVESDVIEFVVCGTEIMDII